MSKLQKELASISAMHKTFSDDDLTSYHDDFVKHIVDVGTGKEDIPPVLATVSADYKNEKFAEQTKVISCKDKKDLYDKLFSAGKQITDKGQGLLIASLASSAWVYKAKSDEDKGKVKDWNKQGGLTDNGKPREGVEEMVFIITRSIDGRTSASNFEIVREGKKIKKLVLKRYIPTVDYMKANKTLQVNILDEVFMGSVEDIYQELRKDSKFEKAMSKFEDVLKDLEEI